MDFPRMFNLKSGEPAAASASPLGFKAAHHTSKEWIWDGIQCTWTKRNREIKTEAIRRGDSQQVWLTWSTVQQNAPLFWSKTPCRFSAVPSSKGGSVMCKCTLSHSWCKGGGCQSLSFLMSRTLQSLYLKVQCLKSQSIIHVHLNTGVVC